MSKNIDDILNRFTTMTLPINSIVVAESLGYKIEWFRPLNDNELDILAFADIAENSIKVNTLLSTEDKLYAVAHELGQILLHPDKVKDDHYPVLTSSNRDEEAYAFSNQLQMPEILLRKYAKVAYTYKELATAFLVKESRLISYMSSL